MFQPPNGSYSYLYKCHHRQSLPQNFLPPKHKHPYWSSKRVLNIRSIFIVRHAVAVAVPVMCLRNDSLNRRVVVVENRVISGLPNGPHGTTP